MTSWLNCCNNLSRSSFSFQDMWFTAEILFDVVIVSVQFQLEFARKRKLQRFFVAFYSWFLFLTSQYLRKKRFWYLQWICCVFSVGFVFGSTDDSSWGGSVLFSDWFLLAWISFSSRVFENQRKNLCLLDIHDFIKFPEKLDDLNPSDFNNQYKNC